MLVVQTSDGKAVFGGEEASGTFKYFLKRGNGGSLIPNPNNRYLVRGDKIPVLPPPFKAEGTGVDLSGLTNPVTVVLTIGIDSGTTTATAQS